MSWAKQVWHIAIKDVRYLRALLVAYVAIIGVAMWNATLTTTGTSPILESSMVFVVVVGTFLTATLVQTDSPTRSDADWATKPFYPSALLASKLMTAVLVVVGLGVLGETIALASMSVRVTDVCRTLADGVRFYALWLVVPFVAAALTRDLRSFVVLMVAGFATLLVALVSVVPRVNIIEWNDGPDYLAGAAILAGAGLVLYLYKTRDTRLWTWIAGASVVVMALVSLARPFAFNDNAAPPVSRPVRLSMRVDKAPDSTGRFVFTLDGAAGNERYELAPGSVTLHSPMGETHLSIANQAVAFTQAAPSASARDQFASAAFKNDIDDATFEGTLLVERQDSTMLPLVLGSRIFWHGQRIRVDEVQSTAGSLTVGVVVTQVQAGTIGNQPSSDDDISRMQFSVDDGRGGRVMLQVSRRIPMMHALVMPGANVRQTLLSLHGTSGSAALPGDGRLAIAQWIPIGQMPVTSRYRRAP